ncbi:conserved hypothetical protein [Ricinus communis]|uniref:Uncharacterized protein n=1 Tax=Ricinus communis TaxID=3988 RepID=B9SU75_RICCO|nr:conserved hypothetical protein [Ricinus communis]
MALKRVSVSEDSSHERVKRAKNMKDEYYDDEDQGYSSYVFESVREDREYNTEAEEEEEDLDEDPEEKVASKLDEFLDQSITKDHEEDPEEEEHVEIWSVKEEAEEEEEGEEEEEEEEEEEGEGYDEVLDDYNISSNPIVEEKAEKEDDEDEALNDYYISSNSVGEKKTEEKDFWSMYPRLDESLKLEHFSAYTLLSSVKQSLSCIGNSKAEELEEKWRKLQAAETKVKLMRAQLIQEQKKIILNSLCSS